jgi:hypothetical protein
MGLLSRISEELPAQVSFSESKKTGLLAKSSKIFAEPVFESFFELCRKYSFSHSALLTLVNDTFVMTQCVGIDSSTVAASVSSRDFWNGTISHSEDFINYKKTDTKFSVFYQLFSSFFKDNIAGLHFLKITDKCIFVDIDFNSFKDILISACELKKTILLYLSSQKKEEQIVLPGINYDFLQSTAFLMLLSVKIAVNSAIRDANISDKILQNTIFSTMYTEIFFTLKKHFKKPNFCIQSTNGEIKLILFTKSKIDDALLQHHIAYSLNPILSSHSGSIILLKAGTAASEDDIRHFILEG